MYSVPASALPSYSRIALAVDSGLLSDLMLSGTLLPAISASQGLNHVP